MIPSSYPSKEEIARLTAGMLLDIKAVDFNTETALHPGLGSAVAVLRGLPEADLLPAYPLGADGFHGMYGDAQRRP